MKASEIFAEIEARIKVLERNINDKIKGNCEENAYTYFKDDRERMQKELTVLQNTLAFLDEQMYLFRVK